MPGLEQFVQRPFDETHPWYQSSCLAFGAQPEYATGDVLLGSCYRELNLVTTKEAEVDLTRIRRVVDLLGQRDGRPAVWEFVILTALRSPPRPNERPPLPQVVPLVPSLASFTGVLGRPRHRWNPGALATHAIASGLGPDLYAEAVKKLACALDVEEPYDDEFALFLDARVAEIEGANRSRIQVEGWRPPELVRRRIVYRKRVEGPISPAEAFARDLMELLPLKRRLTRRQWCALVEALLRLGLASYVLWICRLNAIAWRYALGVLDGQSVPTEADVERELWTCHYGSGAFLDAGHNADPCLRRQIEAYAVARVGINLVLHLLDERGSELEKRKVVEPVPAAEQLCHMLRSIQEGRRHLGSDPAAAVLDQLGSIVEKNATRVAGRSGSPKNLYEFLAYTLQRRGAREASFNQHDQGYLLAKPSTARNAPWVVRPGPALLLAISHLTCKELSGAPATLQHLAGHFAAYGVRISTGDLQEGTVERDLEDLGLVVDSPDAGGGRVVLDPFPEGHGSGVFARRLA